MTDYPELWNLVRASSHDLIAFAQELIRTPSMPGHEKGVAALLHDRMSHLEYDEVWVDEAGSIIGHIVGGDGPSLMFNGHMDHVDAGDPAQWPHPPFGGEIHDGQLWGRGAADMKGALAAMVYAGGLLKKLGVRPPGDLYVSGVVQEEVGGLGARHLVQTLPVDRVVVGEASDNHLQRGHRGRVQIDLRLEGRSAHASMPHLGVNPHFSLSRFLTGLRSIHMAADPDYGASTVTPTSIVSQPDSDNVIPSQLNLVLDWRNVPGEGTEEIVNKLETVLARNLEEGCRGFVQVAAKELASYTGFRMAYDDDFPSFSTPVDHPWLSRARVVLAAVLGREVEVGTWRFATDGGHFAAAGAAVIGFGPGDDTLVHTVEERLPVEQFLESVVGYLALSLS
jgi:putative selenium metabolism hydrolase